MERSFLMTTAPSVEGSSVEQYFGVVATNVVAGTGAFADIAASFSDFFGGRSNAYKKQLESIREEAMNELESKARALGANALISLSIDNDQVSGKNTQMLMISITATAVRLSNVSVTATSGSNNNEEKLTPSQVEHRFKVEKLRSNAEELRPYQIFRDYKELFQAGPSVDVALITLKRILMPQNIRAEDRAENIEKLGSYLTGFSADQQKAVIYGDHAMYAGVERLHELLLKALGKLPVFDFDEIKQLMNHDDTQIASAALIFCRTEKLAYEPSDIEDLEKLIQLAQNRFAKVRELEDVKKVFKGDARIWQCKKGHKNNEDTEFCSECGLSQRDLPKHLLSGAIRALENRVEQIQVAFGFDFVTKNTTEKPDELDSSKSY